MIAYASSTIAFPGLRLELPTVYEQNPVPLEFTWTYPTIYNLHHQTYIYLRGFISFYWILS